MGGFGVFSLGHRSKCVWRLNPKKTTYMPKKSQYEIADSDWSIKGVRTETFVPLLESIINSSVFDPDPAPQALGMGVRYLLGVSGKMKTDKKNFLGKYRGGWSFSS